MEYFRSKKWLKEMERTESFFNSGSESINFYKNNENPFFKCSYISKSIWEDIQYKEFLNNINHSHHIYNFLEKTLINPIYNKDILEQRQNSLIYFKNNKQQCLLTKNTEESYDWLLSLKPDIKNYIMDGLFPKAWLSKWLYWDPLFINLFQIYRGYWSPLAQSIYPISVLLGPYIYLYKKLKWKIPIKSYLKIVYQIIQWIYHSSIDITTKIRNSVVFFIYIGIYLYSFIQVIDWSYQLRKYRNILISRLTRIYKVICDFQGTVSNIPLDFWKPFLPNIQRTTILKPVSLSLKDFYIYWKKKDSRLQIKEIYQVIGIYEGLRSLSSLIEKDWFICSYKYPITFVGSMKHPELIDPIENPICLSNNLIITGPNAGGKTTYMKSLLWNLLMGQSFGIMRGKYGNICLYDAILHHDRIKDSIGNRSLFEAEMDKAKEVLNCVKDHKNVVYFMDEPLHSTPPLDGSSMLKALLFYLSNNNNIKVLLTTHYFSLQELESLLPNKFKNICMEAYKENNNYQFSYKIKRGYSRQSIGIELLKINDFPEEMIKTAIKMKNKLYSLKVNAP